MKVLPNALMCVYVLAWVQCAGVSMHWWQRRMGPGPVRGAFLHMHGVFMFEGWVSEWAPVYRASRAPRQHMAFAATALARVVLLSLAGWQGRGRPSLWLTQAERGFLHIFCHTIWALVSVAAPLRTHLAAHRADGHLLFPTSWWIEKTTTNRPCSSYSLLCILYCIQLHSAF